MQRFLGLKTIPVLLAILIGSLSTQAQAATFTVTKLDDTNDGACNADCSLREAIIAGNSIPGDDVIAFAPAVTGAIDLSSALPDLFSNITVIGPGAGSLAVRRSTAAGTPLFRIFTIQGGFNVSISGIAIRNGAVTGSGISSAFGGAISNDGNLTLTSCTITGSAADGGDATASGAKGSDGQGGAIYNNGTLSLTRCTLSENTATGGNGLTSGGGGAAQGGAIYNSGGSLTLTGCALTNNSTTGGNSGNTTGAGGVSQGGAIRSEGTLSLTNCTLNNNSATGGALADGQGGGIYNEGSATIVTSDINVNSAHGTLGGVGQGGGIRNSGPLKISRTTIADNDAAGGNSQTQGGSASGGGFYNGDVTTVTACTLSGNSSTGGNSGNVQGGAGLGGGIYNNNVATLTLSNSTLSDNSTAGGTSGVSPGIGRGGGLFMQGASTTGSSGTATLISDTIVSNFAGDGGGVLVSSGTATLNNTLVAFNAGSPSPDVRGTVVSTSKFNLISNGSGMAGISNGANGNQIGTAASPINPQIGPLQDNGGPTQTRGLLPGSPAIDQGKAFTLTDQRGEPRPFDFPAIGNAVGGDGSDIGAFEVQNILISVATARTVLEGSVNSPGSTNFIVTLSAPSSQPVTVDYKTANGTAIAGSDYVNKAATLTFAPGETSKSVTVFFIGDAVPEADEFFYLGVSNATNAGIADPRGSATIRNDDGPSITIDNAVAVNEGDSGTVSQTFTLHLSAASATAVTVDFATANGTANTTDYVAATGTVTFAPGEVTKTITIQVKGDTTVEPDETYAVNLSHSAFAVVADSQATAVIRNDDAVTGGQLFQDEPSQ